MYTATKEQLDKIAGLKILGYKWNKAKSLSAVGVIFEKEDDLWFFGLNGEIMHNPDSLTISVKQL